MKDNILFQNNSHEEKGEDEDNNSLFQINSNALFPNQDTSNYFNNIVQLNDEGDEQAYNINEYNVGDFENSLKNDLFQENENNLNKDFSLISPIPGNEDDYKLINKDNIPKAEILYKDNNSSGSGLGTDCTPPSTGGSAGKSQSKDNSLNNSNINNNLFNSSIDIFNNEHINNKTNKKTK